MRIFVIFLQKGLATASVDCSTRPLTALRLCNLTHTLPLLTGASSSITELLVNYNNNRVFMMVFKNDKYVINRVYFNCCVRLLALPI